MQRSDLPEVLAIEAQAFADPWPERAFQNDLDDPALAFARVARAGEEAVVGYMVAWRVADELHLTNLAVHPAHRREGVGQRLLDDLFEEARKVQSGCVTLEVRRSNAGAIALYQRNGFVAVAIRRNYYHVGNEDAVVMAIDLTGRGLGRTPR